MTEKAWQQVILDAARWLGYECYHTAFSLKSSPGFPDLVCAHAGPPPRLVAIEVKSERGRVTPAQARWIALFDAVPGVTAMVARPSDWDRVEAALKGERA